MSKNEKTNAYVKRALLIGNSDGIGLATTKELLKKNWQVVGISRSESKIKQSNYIHIVENVQDDNYIKELKNFFAKESPIDLCIYFVGIGVLLDLNDMDTEVEIVDVNFLSMVKTASIVIPQMVKRGSGHFIGISSVADELLSADAPSYHASKAGFSNYLEGLALAVKKKGVAVTNVRFGFVDTKMAKGNVKPFMISVTRAVEHLQKCIKKRPVRYTAPKKVIPLLKLRKIIFKTRKIFFR